MVKVTEDVNLIKFCTIGFSFLSLDMIDIFAHYYRKKIIYYFFFIFFMVLNNKHLYTVHQHVDEFL
jgi:hypothetical protein